ncbi:unnamed protein product [Ranitomeya imitator]|uniref:RING-type domain-containing protein n=1 Tax=Ranitomeya imitator TaxID=111125 RepID=A0ABN9MQ90_9NEOB|nr:unnamed protein product [Ranitomeya imitator]
MRLFCRKRRTKKTQQVAFFLRPIFGKKRRTRRKTQRFCVRFAAFFGPGSAAILDPGLEQGGREVLECGVCEDVFTLQGDKVPRLLLCGHTVCHDCLTRLPLHGRAIRCPFDRQVTELGDSGVWGLKKNFALLELLERLQNGASGQSGASEEAVGGYGEEDKSRYSGAGVTVSGGSASMKRIDLLTLQYLL